MRELTVFDNLIRGYEGVIIIPTLVGAGIV